MAATGSYVTTTLLKERLDPNSQYSWAAAENTLLDKLVAETNQWVESFTGTVLAPVTYTAAEFDAWPYPDGNLHDHRRTLYFPWGIRTVTTLEYAPSTGGTFIEIDSTDYFLRPNEQDRLPGMPADRIVLSDLGGIARFPVGYEVIRVTGTGGPSAVPDDVRMVAVTIAERCWLASKAGRADEVQTVEADGSVTVTRYVAAEDKHTLRRYKRPLVA